MFNKQDLHFSVSSHVNHVDDSQSIDIHQWSVYCCSYATGNWTVFSSYSLNTLAFVGKDDRQVVAMHSSEPFSHTFDNHEEAERKFNELCLKAFTCINGYISNHIKESEAV